MNRLNEIMNDVGPRTYRHIADLRAEASRLLKEAIELQDAWEEWDFRTLTNFGLTTSREIGDLIELGEVDPPR